MHKDVLLRLVTLFILGTPLLQPKAHGLPDLQHPPCIFNQLCSCLKSGPATMGLVQCHKVKMLAIPEDIKGSTIFILSLRSNNLRQVQNSSFHGTGMWRLQISENDLTNLPDGALKGLEKTLWELDLSKNQLFNAPKNAMKRLQKLTNLDLSYNRITSVHADDFSTLGNTLKTLNLAGNAISHIDQDSFENLKVLDSLNLESNFILGIHEFSFKSRIPQLQYLNLANNQLDKIPFMSISYLKDLRVLNMRGNQIASLYDELFQGKLVLDELNIEDNDITDLQPFSFRNFDIINKTYLGDNGIEILFDEVFRDAKISEIRIPFCQIWNISTTAFQGLEKTLHVLDIGFNELNVFPKEALDEIENLKELDLRMNHISIISADSLESFQYTLQSLDVTGPQELEYVKYSNEEGDMLKLRNVRRLSLGSVRDNILSKEDLESYGPATEYLNLMNTGITNIEDEAFQNTPGLRILNLSMNSIHTIGTDAFKDISNTLEVLNMHHSLSMSALPTYALHHLRNIKELDLSDNGIVTLPMDSFRYMSNLKHLYFDFNSISDLQLGHFFNENNPELVSIHMSFNKLKEIQEHTFEGLEKLKLIDLSDNSISYIQPEAFMNLKSIVYINLQGNTIAQIGVEAFRNIPRLRTLDISYNSLDHLNFGSFDQVGTLSTFKIDAKHNLINELKNNNDTVEDPIVNINGIDLSHNNISYVQDEFFDPVRNSLTQLTLSNNMLTEISTNELTNMKHLQILELDNNFIGHIEIGALRGTQSLQVLNLSNNMITELPSSTFHKIDDLRVLDISNNQLHGFKDEQFTRTSLEFLYAQNNELSHVPEKSLQKVNSTIRGINIAGNKIRTLTRNNLVHFRNLLQLDISRNKVKKLEDGVFSALHSLVDLDISFNPIDKITSSTFKGLDDTLETLNMASTNLTVLPPFYLPNLLRLNISRNSLQILEQSSISNISNLRGLDMSGNQLKLSPNNVWLALPNLQSIHLSQNPIANIFDNSFYGLKALNELYIQDLPLEQLHTSAFKSLPSLETVAINSNYTSTVVNGKTDASLGDVLSENRRLRHVIVKIDSADGTTSESLKGNLPRKVNKVTIFGESLQILEDSAIEDWLNYDIELEIRQTNLTRISAEVFNKMRKIRHLSLDVRNNQLAYLGDLTEVSSSLQPNNKIQVKKLLLSGNPWKCDCDLAWVMQRMKQSLHEKLSQKVEKELGEMSLFLEDLRHSRCRGDNENKTLIEFFKSGLDCGLARFKGSGAQGLKIGGVALPLFLVMVVLSLLVTGKYA